MNNHYFVVSPTSPSKERKISYEIDGMSFSLITDANVFAKNGIDYGSYLLLKVLLPIINAGKVLDIGCGYGVIGLTLAYRKPDILLTSSDVNLRAINLTIKNARALRLSNRVVVLQSNLFEKIEGEFSYIISNPPIRAGKKVLDNLYLGAYSHLEKNGSLYLVVRRKQGAESTISRLKEIYSSVNVLTKDKGYWIIRANKK